MTKVIGTVEDNFEWEVNRKKKKKKRELKKPRQFSKKKDKIYVCLCVYKNK